LSEYVAERPHAGHRIPKIRWPSSIAGAMTVVVPQLAQGGGDGWNSGGDGWNSSDMTVGSLNFRREHNLSLCHRRLARGRCR